MENLSAKTWKTIHEFLLSISNVDSLAVLNSRVLSNLPGLIHFENSGVFIDLDRDMKPSINIKDSIRIREQWSRSFNDYYYKVGVFPDIDKNIFSADYHNPSRYGKDEYVNDYIVPQGIHYSAGLIIFGEKYKPTNFLVLNRTADERAFNQHELSILKIIQPHLSNLYTIARELEKFKRMPLMLAELEQYHRLLSPRESEIVHLLARRLKPREIADELKISYYTVRKHVENIYKKLEVANRHQLFQRIHSDYSRRG